MRKRSYGAVLLGAATVLAGAAIATAGDESNPEAPSADSAAVAAVSPEAPALIAAFRRDQREGDRFPGDAHAALADVGEAQPGEQPSMARKLAFAGGRELRVWPKAYGVCYAEDGGGGCFDTSFLRRRGLVAGTSFRSGTSVVRVYGIARDGIGSATFTLGDGRRVDVAIRDNGFIVDVPDPQELTWRNPDGSNGRQSVFAPAPE